MTINAEFLDLLYGDAEGLVSVWWRPEAGAKQPYSKSAWFTWPAEKTQMLDFIVSIDDHDVCVTTSTYETKRRLPEFTETTSVIWMDSDTCKGERYRVTPSWTTITSPGRWQHFWVLDQPVETNIASELVHRISIAHDKDGADQSSWPSNKIMRVPGTANTSHGFPTTVTGSGTGELYSFEDLAEKYSDVVIPERAVLQNMPELDVTELPHYGNVLAKLSPDLMDLATSEPKEDQDRSRLRYKLLLELFRAGLSFEEVMSVAWNAPASRKWSEEDSRGIRGLAGEAVKAAVEAGTPSPEPSDPYSHDEDDSEMAVDRPAMILTPEERESLKTRKTFIDRYVTDADKKLPHDNRSYDRLSAWMILSLAYAKSGFGVLGNGKLKVNFFGITVGDTTSGKTSSRRLEMSYIKELFGTDLEYNLGGNSSEVALVKALHAREGRPALYHSDEAAAVFKVWIGQDWSAGMLERITELYDGDVNPLLRSQKNDTINKTTEAHFNVHLTGALRGIMPYLDEELFEKGFIPRFLFAIGQPPRDDFDSYGITQGDGKDQRSGFDPAVRQHMTNMRSRADKLAAAHAGNGTPIFLDEAANARMSKAAWALREQYKNELPKLMLRASILRWRDNVWKAALLLAMDDDRTTANLSDMIHALAAGEEWFTNLIRILTKMGDSGFERKCHDIEQYVEGRGGKVLKSSLYRKFRGIPDREMGEYLKSLANQRRVWGPGSENGKQYFYSARSTHEEGGF